MSEFWDVVQKRRTRRHFLQQDIPLKTMLKLLDVFRYAPSGANRQPWKVILVRDESTRKEIRRIAEDAENDFHRRAPDWMKAFFQEQGIGPQKPFLTDAPYLVCVFGLKKSPYYKESLWIAVGWFLLAVTNAQLGTVPYTPSRKRAISQVLEVDLEWDLQVILPVGFPDPDEFIAQRPKRGVESFLSLK
ncbi:MAG: nitroreductase family protein [Calditrichaeota bacterium]|nr:nitroreductase family protein [Calditrichota bacterium]